MKIFWTILLLLVVTAGLFLISGRQQTAPGQTPRQSPKVISADMPNAAEARARLEASRETTDTTATTTTQEGAVEPDPESTPEADPTDGAATGVPEISTDQMVEPVPGPTPEPVESTSAEPADALIEVPATPEPALAPTENAAPADADPLPETTDTPEIDLSAIPVTAPDGSGVIPELSVDEHGFIVADHPDSRPVAMAPEGHRLRPDLPEAERYKLAGSGTADDPYQLTWDVLVSASETYRPRKGEKELPQWVRQIDGKHVEIGGYLLFPLMSDVSDEFLLTLNQWDGCCIGIPPTPYDAVEVKLVKSAEIDTWRVNYGKVRGILKVDPYLVSNWLVGLYLLEDGELELGS